MKNILFALFIIITVFKVYSQDKRIIYLDDSYNPIGIKEFKYKADSNFYTDATFANDTAIFHKLRYREYYGKLNFQKKHQLNLLFSNRYGIDTTKVWIIHYKDSLPDIKKMRNKSGTIILDSTGKEISEILSWNQYRRSKFRNVHNRHLKKYVISYEDFKKNFDFEKDYFGKQKKMQLIHFYGINKGYPTKNDRFNWIEDSGKIISKLFTDALIVYKNIVLHPDGNFYTITHDDSLDRQKEKINFKSFQKSKKEWKRQFDRLQKHNHQ